MTVDINIIHCEKKYITNCIAEKWIQGRNQFCFKTVFFVTNSATILYVKCAIIII